MAIAQQVEELKFVFNVENAGNVSHVSLFILPDTPFDPNYSALIYFQLPGSNEYLLLGRLTEARPSAIFKIKNIIHSNKLTQIDDDAMIDEDSTAVGENMVIGISIEPNVLAEQALANRPREIAGPESSSTAITKQDTIDLAKKIVTNAYDFLSGFVDENNKVSMKVLDRWWDKFQSKVSNDPKFLEN